MKTDQKEAGKIVLYKGKGGKVELRADTEKETLWATQEQIGRLFQVSSQNITMHLRNIFSSRELKKISVCKESLHTAKDGKRYKVIFYNLDAIIAVGYRVNSRKATQFRIWATRILREYLVNGFGLNETRLIESEDKFEDLDKAINFIKSNVIRGKVKAKVSVRFSKEVIS